MLRLKVHIEYRSKLYSELHNFRRRVILGEGRIILAVKSCREISCTSCLARREFIEDALILSGREHSWIDNDESVTFDNTGATSASEVVEFLIRALPTATSIKLY